MTETQEMSLTVFDPMKAAIGEIVQRDSLLVFDHTTPDGEKDLRSYVYRIKRHKGDLEKVRKEAKAGVLKFGRTVDDIAKELNQPLLTIISDRMKPLDAIEARKRADAEAAVESERVEQERIEAARLADLKRREEAVVAKEAEQKAIVDAAKKKQDEAERIIREKKIAEDAAESAKKQAEVDKAEALEKAEREKQEAIESERAKTAKVEADRIAEEKKKEQLEEAQRKKIASRQKNKSRRKAIDDKVLEHLHGCTGDEKISKNVLFDLTQGLIPHVTINY